jgi:ribosomal protein L11
MVAYKAQLALTLLASAIHVSANTKPELGPRGIFDPVCKRIREETPDSTEVYYIGI